eukprot:EG_transcript_20199
MAGWDWAPTASGFVAGTVGVLVSHPFDTIKTRIQAGWQGRHGVLHVTLQEQGLPGLYRGILPPLLNAGIIQAVSFTIFQHCLNALEGTTQHPAFIAGLISGALPSPVLLPGYFVKIQLQNEKGRRGTGTVAFCRQLVQRHGLRPVLRAMYGRAFPVSFLADCLGRGFYFGTYDVMKRTLAEADRPLTLPRRVLAASCSGIAGWCSMYWLDTWRSCIMSGAIVGNPQSAWDVARGMYAAGGGRAFFRGFHVTLLRAVPVAASVLTMYDLVYESLKGPPTPRTIPLPEAPAFPRPLPPSAPPPSPE